MPRMKIIDKLVTNSLLLFNKNMKIQDRCHLKPFFAATKIFGATQSTMSEEQILL